MINDAIFRPDYAPTLAIGLGGTGVAAVRALALLGTRADGGAKSFDPELSKAMATKRIVTVGIDTDPTEFDDRPVRREAYPKGMQQYFDDGTLPESFPGLDHLVAVDRTGVKDLVALARELARARLLHGNVKPTEETEPAELVHAFMGLKPEQYDRVVPPGDEAEEGAGQLRSLGRISLLSAINRIYDTLTVAKASVRFNENIGQKINIVLFGSLAGGTGSGMFMDVALLLRYIIAPSAKIHAFFLLPEIFQAQTRADRIWPNTYAALKEVCTLGIPRRPEPVTLPYRIHGNEHPVSIQAGDPAVFNSIYLFDTEASHIDWSPEDQSVMRAAQVESAARCMADTALALMRDDLMKVLKDIQNLHIKVRDERDLSRRMFHFASAVPLRPQASVAVLPVLAAKIWETFEAKSLRPLEIGVTIPAQFTIERDFRRQIISGGGNGAGLSFTRDRDARHIKQHVRSYLAPILSEAVVDDRLKRLDKRYDEKQFREFLESEGLYALFQFIHENMPARRRLVDALRPPHVDIPLHVLFTRQIQEAVQELTTSLETIERNLGNLKHLDQVSVRAVEQVGAILQGWKDTPTPSTTVAVRFPTRAVYIKSILASIFGSGAEREQARTRIQTGGAGPLSTLLRHIGNQLLGLINSSLEEKETQEALAASNLPREIIARWARSPDANRLVEGPRRRLLETNRRNSECINDLRDDAVSILNSRKALLRTKPSEVARFNTILEPLAPMMIGYGRTIDQRDSRNEPDDSIVESPDGYKAMRDKTQRAIEDRLKAERLNTPGVAIFDPLARTFWASRNRTHNAAPILDVVADVIAENWLDLESLTFSLPTDSVSTGLRDGFHQRFNATLSAADAFLKVILDNPAFELSRLDGKDGIARIVDLCQASPFSVGTVGGQLHARELLVALPARDGETALRRETENEIKSIVRNQLQLDPRLANPSTAPLIFQMARYHGAYQLKHIDRYRDAYEHHTEDQKRLFHTIPEAVFFDPPKSQRIILPGSLDAQMWACPEHPGFQIPPDHSVCPWCIEEYQEDRRAFRDVQFKSSALGFTWPFAPTDPASAVDLTIQIKPFFENGVRPEQRDHGGVQGEFNRLLGRPELAAPGDAVDKQTDPPTLLFPAIPLESDRYKFVYRSSAYARFTVDADVDDDRILECFHCSFPILLDSVFNASDPLPSATCPRCRREVEACFSCTAEDAMLMVPIKDPNTGSKRCPNCSNQMERPEEIQPVQRPQSNTDQADTAPPLSPGD